MPSSRKLPTIEDYLEAAATSVISTGSTSSNTRRGAMFDRSYGGTAILWTREAARDRDMFRALHFDSAQGSRLTSLGDRYGVARELDTYGVGSATIRRASSGAGAGTIWKGTQIGVYDPSGSVSVYTVTEDTPVGATATYLRDVSITATRLGSAGAIDVTTGAAFIDTVFDLTLYVESLSCGPGEDLEQPDAFRARAREELAVNRVGYTPKMIEVLRSIGASKAVLLSSDYSGATLDHGINVCYVGDDSFQGTRPLIAAAQVALEGVRVLGCDLMVLGMAQLALAVTAALTVWDSKSLQNRTDIDARARAAVGRYFADPTNAFAYKRDAIAGAIVAACPEVSDAAITLPATDATLSATAWPFTLPVYRVNTSSIQLTIQ